MGNIGQVIASRVQRRNRTLALAAGSSVTCVVIVAAVFFGASPGDSQPAPLQSPTPSLSPESNVRGWPTTGRNASGVYSLDGFRSCGRGGNRWSSCNIGWLHNGHGSSDFDIWILGVDPLATWMPEWARSEIGSGGDNLADGTPVVVAGYDGYYRKVDDRRERWRVDIEGTPVAIQLTAKPGTSRADFAEAHAIIDSLRTAPSDHQSIGFSLVFTLTSNDWDSG